MILRRAQPWLGTVVEIVAEGADVMTIVTAMDHAFARVAAVHAAMSFQLADSELSRVNREAARGWVTLSPDLAAVFTAALGIAHDSDGLFDPTVAAWLVESGHLPRHPEVDANASPGWQAIELDGKRVRYARPLLVDFSGIAKGFAVDAALDVLRRAGLAAATVNAGGDLAHFGARAIPVQVRHPRLPTHILPLINLHERAAATSGGYFQPGALRHPKTGEFLCGHGSVTVVAPTCMQADALTKVVAADPAGASRMLARHDAQAILLDDHQARFGDAAGWRPVALAGAA